MDTRNVALQVRLGTPKTLDKSILGVLPIHFWFYVDLIDTRYFIHPLEEIDPPTENRVAGFPAMISQNTHL